MKSQPSVGSALNAEEYSKRGKDASEGKDYLGVLDADSLGLYPYPTTPRPYLQLSRSLRKLFYHPQPKNQNFL